MVSPAHRFLSQRRPDAQGVWVLDGPATLDLFYHDLYHGCVGLRRTIELWAVDEWEGGSRPLTVTLSDAGELDFSGNTDPAEALRRFESIRNPRPPRYGPRPNRRRESTSEASDETADAADRAASGTRDAVGGGQILINAIQKLAAAMQSRERIAIIVEKLSYQLRQLELQGESAAVHRIPEIVQEEWIKRVKGRSNAIIVFLESDAKNLKRYLPDTVRGVQWRTLDGPKSPEIAEALLRLGRRRGFAIRDIDQVANFLTSKQDLGVAIGAAAKIVARGRDVSLATVADLPPVNDAEVERILAELDQLTGLAEVKEKARTLVAAGRQRRTRLEQTGDLPEETLHMMFSGAAGTGKTTVARIFARLYHAIGLLPTPGVNEAKASQGIFSPTVNETQVNMQRLLENSLRGVLFIDEAHLLGEANGRAAKEAVAALVPMAFDHRHELVIILAGYADKLPDVLTMDEGMPGRFPEHGRLEFTDYTSNQLWDMMIRKIAARGFMLEAGSEARYRMLLARRAQRPGFGNARGVGNVINEIVDLHDARGDTTRTLGVEDLPPLVVRHEEQLTRARAELNRLCGVAGVRQELKSIVDEIAVNVEDGVYTDGVPSMLFVGPPGTGKTTVARLMANMLYGEGAIERAHLLDVTAVSLKGAVIGAAQELVRKAITDARGGVLLIDEAYDLWTGERDSFGREAVSELIGQMTRPENSGTVFILAGYEDRINELLESNVGLARRFPRTIRFNNFSADECVQIAEQILTEREFRASAEFLEQFRIVADNAIRQQGRRFGNAGWVHNRVSAALSQRASRVRDNAIPLGDPRRRVIEGSDLVRASELIDETDAPVGTNAASGQRGTAASARTASKRRIIATHAPAPSAVTLRTHQPELGAASGLTDFLETVTAQILVSRGMGAGFLVTSDGVLATNAHVVTGEAGITAVFRDRRAEADVLLIDEDVDLALLRIEPFVDSATPYLALGSSAPDLLRGLDEVVAAGFAHADEGAPPGVISARVSRNDGSNWHRFEADGGIEQGFSGGPVAHPKQGAVAGIVQAGMGSTVKVMIRVELLREMLGSLGYGFEPSQDPAEHTAESTRTVGSEGN